VIVGLQVLLGFAPFIAFAIIEKLVGITSGLTAAFAISLALVAWEAVRHRTANILELGSALLFGGLALLALRGHRAWSVWEVRLYVDGGLALVVFLSVLLRRPFTLHHARKRVSADAARQPGFLRRNDILSGAWGLAFVGLAATDLYMTSFPGAPDRRGIIMTLAILGAAAKFTQWYVTENRART
jgi:hypothetical protein